MTRRRAVAYALGGALAAHGLTTLVTGTWVPGAWGGLIVALTIANAAALACSLTVAIEGGRR
jgi:hypothetical protein